MLETTSTTSPPVNTPEDFATNAAAFNAATRDFNGNQYDVFTAALIGALTAAVDPTTYSTCVATATHVSGRLA